MIVRRRLAIFTHPTVIIIPFAIYPVGGSGLMAYVPDGIFEKLK